MPRTPHFKLMKILTRTLTSVALISLTMLAGTAASRAKDPVNLQFWDMNWAGPEYIDAGKALVEKFNQEHPDIKVTYRTIAWKGWYTTFVTAVASGTAPDISTGAGYQAVQLYDQGAILPIDDVIAEWKASGNLDDFLPNTVETLKYDDHYVALPWAIDIRVWYYRKDLLEQANVQPPTSWEEMKAAAKALTKPDNDQYGMVTAGDTTGAHLVLALILNNGGGLFTEDRELNVSTDRNLEALEYLGDLAENRYVYPASAGYSGDDAVSAFSQGKGSLFLQNPGLTSRLPKLADKIGILRPPTGPHGGQGTIYWINNIMLYKQGKHPAEAKVFLKWWSENQKELWTKGLLTQLPARKSFATDPFFAGNAETKFILDNYVPVAKTTATHATGIFPKLNDVEGEGVLQTLAQGLLEGKNVDAAVKTATERLKSIMED